MKKIATVSYNMHCNFDNYGSALQTYALQRVINELDPENLSAVVLDYCPDCLSDVDPLNPIARMWDADEESRKMVELSMGDIRENHAKFEHFYREVLPVSNGSYTSANFDSSLDEEHLDGYVCGSDTIFCIREFGGFDDGYFAHYPSMRRKSISYAASFGDVDWTEPELETLSQRLGSFKAIGIREGGMLPFVQENVDAPAARVCDPTLLLLGSDYDCITADPQLDEPYVLLYSRRYSPEMERYADDVAKRLGCKVVDINLRATNAEKGHIMRYDAGVEEYLALAEHAEYMVTNSYHGLIFAAQKHTPFSVFSREQADTKIDALLSWIGLEDRKMISGQEDVPLEMGFEQMEEKLVPIRTASLEFLRSSLELIGQ